MNLGQCTIRGGGAMIENATFLLSDHDFIPALPHELVTMETINDLPSIF